MIEELKDTVVRDTTVTIVDSVHTIVNITETRIIHLQDTIVTHVYDTIQPDLITVYERLITAQDDKFEFTLYAIAIIVTVLVVLVTLSNILLSKKLIKYDFEKSFKKEKKEIRDTLDELNRKYHRVKGESARLFAIRDDKDLSNMAGRLGWWTECVKEYSLAEREKAILGSCKSLIYYLNAAIEFKDVFIGSFEDTDFTFENMRENVSCVPSIVSEKVEIVRLLDELEDYYKEVEGVIEEAEVVE
ncbi:hypothetical protein DWB61_02670 [Ancylomarina euxinus]|uniref:Uncharacterized protein n=1 Tax=Ancylomarina euxinus TaxID=2283627 RepID=A0A425Y6F6_9BACT|nr:hypothetical protein [Ancylomarina euxinus]MCZ4694094.1 hypothetical protein [Ancylomarina euxinus]MUP15759.1 hypothetical protein [Ancylomarina euxinus]RRG24036.1 hypothetical protein DWB61_02670 [Ancylomarina euxinus]